MVDLKSGYIDLRSDATNIAENVAMTFSACVLYVLCKPDINAMESSNDSPSVTDNDPCFPFFDAAGINVTTPSNSWLYSNRHKCGDYLLKSYSQIAQFCPWDPDSTPGDGCGSSDFPDDLSNKGAHGWLLPVQTL